MRYILGFCVALAVANLTGIVERAYAQTPAAGRAVPAPPAQGTAGAVENAVQQNLVPGGTTTQSTVTNPANANPAPGIPGTVTSTPATTTTATTNAIQNPTSPGAVIGNPATVTTTAPGYVAPGTVNAETTNNPAYSSYYVPGTQTVTTPGVAIGGINSVNPMGTTMPIGTYYSGAGVGPYSVYPRTTTYSSMYVTPGYTTAGQTYYTTPVQTYPIRQRRGLFGGLFGRRNRVYTTAPYTYTYGTAPGTYTYGTAPY
ncbi:MAG: hypothetical protein ACLQGP_11605 [Isosphaeraceae bacterium]